MIESLYSVIVNWNLKEDTRICVASLFAAGAKAGQVVVVDNGSTDGSVVELCQRFGVSVQVLPSGQNLGYGGGANLGIEFALTRKAEWVLLLNNDTQVAPTFLVELEEAVTPDKQFAIFGPVILYSDVPNRISYFGDRLIAGSLATVSLYRDKEVPDQLPPLVPVDFISGCAMLFRADVFKRIGLFDSSFFMYGEEVDLIWRARRAGYRLAVATRAKMWHEVSRSANLNERTTRYLRIRNQIRVYRKYSEGIQSVLMFGFVCLRTIRIAVDDFLHWRLSMIGPLLTGWVDGWRGRDRNSY